MAVLLSPSGSLRCLLLMQDSDSVQSHLDGALHRNLGFFRGGNRRVVPDHTTHCEAIT